MDGQDVTAGTPRATSDHELLVQTAGRVWMPTECTAALTPSLASVEMATPHVSRRLYSDLIGAPECNSNLSLTSFIVSPDDEPM